MPLILTALVAIILSQRPTTEPRLMRQPCIHGDTVVFSYAGDLWVTHSQGGIARRLTTSPGVENNPQISPDGQTVAFSGQYEGLRNIYTNPIEGGEPKRLTYGTGDICLGWTPDGNIAYGAASGSTNNRQGRLWFIDPAGGLPHPTKLEEVASLSFFPDGKTIAYNRQFSFNFNWRRYRGGSQGKISFYNFPENKYWELPSKREQSYFPLVVGRAVFYISDRSNGVQNLYRYDLASKKDRKLTDYNDADIRTPSTDGKTIGLLIGELGTSHTYVSGGDYLLAIDDKPVDLHIDPSALLLGKVNRYVTLTVNSAPTVAGSRKVRVRPIGNETNVRYVDFIDKAAKTVSELSHGRIGYMHIRDTSEQGADDFIRGFYSQTDKDAVIVDERWNGGGHPQTWFVDTLARKMYAFQKGRDVTALPSEYAITGPKAMLINGYAGSGGDFFPYMFRLAGSEAGGGEAELLMKWGTA